MCGMLAAQNEMFHWSEVVLGGDAVIFDREIHVAVRCANEEYEHREAQNSFDHQKWLTRTGVMIVGGVSFFSDTRVKSAGRP